MVISETLSIYGVDRQGSVCLRGGNVVPADDEILVSADNALRPIYVEGLQPGDFSVFASVTDMEGANEVPYLVTHRDGSEGIIVPEVTISADVNSYATPELAKLLHTIPPSEIAQFGIESLIKQLQRRFPPKRM